MKRGLVALCMVSLVSASLSAELKYTMHVEVKKSDAAVTPPSHPLLAMMGDAVVQQLVPDGSADLIFILGEKGARTEALNAVMGQAAGTVTLLQPDGTMAVLNPKDQTYWKTTIQSATTAIQGSGMKAEATSTRSGEFETVAGVRCERVPFTVKMNLPIPEATRAGLGGNFPTSIEMAGDSCVTTDQFQRYAAMAAKSQATGMIAALGLDKMTQGGIVLRQNLRVGGIEMLSTVTTIGEEQVPASAFEIPPGYKEIPAPTGGR